MSQTLTEAPIAAVRIRRLSIPTAIPGLDPARFSVASRRRLSAPGLRTFASIADLWGLTEEQRRLVLGMPSRSTYQNWMRTAREHRDVTLDVDTLTRISAVLGIHAALGVIHATESETVAWLRGPHEGIVFGGNPPLQLVTSGVQDDLLAVRRFLDAARTGAHPAPVAGEGVFRRYTDADIVFS